MAIPPIERYSSNEKNVKEVCRLNLSNGMSPLTARSVLAAGELELMARELFLSFAPILNVPSRGNRRQELFMKR
jgi:hypothetical protein